MARSETAGLDREHSNGSASYDAFLQKKLQLGGEFGFKPLWMPPFLFDFQAALTEWAIRRGRGALFEDCGLGKTPQQLVWAENVARKTNKPVLILTPLAVGQQTVKEGEKFGIEVKQSREGKVYKPITVSNYERLHYFNPSDFAGVVADESSAIKAFDGKRRAAVTEFLRVIPYRLLCTATAAPNDYIELGTSSEALGELGYMDMLNRFFKNEQGTSATNRYHGQAAKWRFKGHAEIPFWRWVCSWARALRRPSDLGFTDDKFKLPKLIEREHRVESKKLAPGMLFPLPAVGLQEEREERRRTLVERCESVAALVGGRQGASVSWCHLNAEGDLLAKLIPNAEQVKGSDPEEKKEETLLAFQNGDLQRLVIKPKIAAFGLNWEFCSYMTFFAWYSYEQYYQGVRRCWRFGQKNPVEVDIVTTEGEIGALKAVRRKSAAADRMFSALVARMNEAQSLARGVAFEARTEVPSWL